MMGQYPPGVADGPQIEANLLYVINNFNSVFGTPYKVVRIPMPADNGQYPSGSGRYFTYTNSSFINKTIIVPAYDIPSDTTAIRIYQETMPGYNVVGINSLASIGSLGSLHCITKEIGTDDPLLISHQPLPDTYNDVNPYTVQALMKHRSSISTATLWYRTDTLQPYISVPMTVGFNPDYWLADIPAQPVGTFIYYYVHAEAVSGKQQSRPMPAPDGYWKFEVLGNTGVNQIENAVSQGAIFPNPSKGITCIPVYATVTEEIEITFSDVLGQDIRTIYKGSTRLGENRYFIDTANITAGVYLVTLKTGSNSNHSKLIVR
jgi:hypothetical protein